MTTTMTQRLLWTAVVVLLHPAPIRAEGPVANDAQLPVNAEVQHSVQGEAVAISATVLVEAEVTASAGGATASLTCKVNGSGKGSSGGASYRVAGFDSRELLVPGPLPADFDAVCPAHLVSPASAEPLDLRVRLRGTVDPVGRTTFVVVDTTAR